MRVVGSGYTLSLAIEVYRMFLAVAFSRVRAVYGDGSITISFICYYYTGVSKGVERNKQV